MVVIFNLTIQLKLSPIVLELWLFELIATIQGPTSSDCCSFSKESPHLEWDYQQSKYTITQGTDFFLKNE